MKFISKIAALAAAVVALGACDEFDQVGPKADRPEHHDMVEITPNSSIAELCSRYTEHGKPVRIQDDCYIAGRVISNDKQGNFYKSIFIQDEQGNGGIEVKIGAPALYNRYKPGQLVYVRCKGLVLGEYGYKSGRGNGTISIGWRQEKTDEGLGLLPTPPPTPNDKKYENGNIELPALIDDHVLAGTMGNEVRPFVITEDNLNLLPGTNDSQATNKLVGRLVTFKGLKYKKGVFCLIYVNSNLDKQSNNNRIFLSDDRGVENTWGITTWAMSKEKMTQYLTSGVWDEATFGDSTNKRKIGDLKGDGTYPEIEKNAASVSQKFTLGSKEIQVRTSGYSKFSDEELPQPLREDSDVTVDITGVLSLYQGGLQLTIRDLNDVHVNM